MSVGGGIDDCRHWSRLSPFVMAGGLLLLYQIGGEVLTQFMTGFVTWLEVQ